MFARRPSSGPPTDTESDTIDPIGTIGSDNEESDGGDQFLFDTRPWTKFEGKPELPGLLNCFVVVLKDKFLAPGQTKETPMNDVENSEEKNFTQEVCHYLLNNRVSNIQVSSNYPEYAQAVAADMKYYTSHLDVENVTDKTIHKRANSTDVTVVLLLNCHGVWQQRRMWQLMVEAFETSQLGVILLGHVGITEIDEDMHDSRWKTFVDYLNSGKGWTDKLTIVCHRHQLVNSKISTAEDLQTQSPNGGCAHYCGVMPCGHFCNQPCHPKDPHHASDQFRCWRPCKRRCPAGHPCNDVCWKECSNCFFVLTVQNTCEHADQVREQQIFCFQRNQQLCKIRVVKDLACGHPVEVYCSQDVSDLPCTQQVKELLPCGHLLLYRCGDDLKKYRCTVSLQKKFPCGHTSVLTCPGSQELTEELVCQSTCTFKLNCGHDCDRPCHTNDPEHNTLLCQVQCERMCARGVHPCAQVGNHPCHQPCPPCQSDFDFGLVCGHYVLITCSDPDPDEDNWFCSEPCLRKRDCRHPCTKMCGEDCGVCEGMADKVPEGCTFGHTQKVRCQERPKGCRVKVIPRHVQPDCGHIVLVRCSEVHDITKEELTLMCRWPCEEHFDDQTGGCGHFCRGSCVECFQGRFHTQCKEPCGKTLICGHSCTTPCGMNCPPCRYPCFNSCEHGKCELECGVPCERNCQEPCSYECVHSKCTNKCGQVCNKPICNQPCPKCLPCGHPCIGFCGEECPPLCRTCHKDKLLEGIMLSGNDELGPEDRFIYLRDCGHCVESTFLENWLNTPRSEEILPLVCPQCGIRIQWIKRYSKLLDENWQLVNSVRKSIFGDMKKIQAMLDSGMRIVLDHLEKTGELEYFPEFGGYLKAQLAQPIGQAPDEKKDFPRSMNQKRAEFIHWVCNQWVRGSETCLDLHLKILEPQFKLLVGCWEEFLHDFLEGKNWPLHPNQMQDLQRERQRLQDLETLYYRMARSADAQRKLLRSKEGMRVFEEAERVLRQFKPYSKEVRARLLAQLKELDGITRYTLGLTDRERQEIVLSFGGGSGRWFKCVNGHVYVITECGGATEVSKCNECGAPIGGENHVTLEQNYLASEMDGAEAPLYPTALTRNNAN